MKKRAGVTLLELAISMAITSLVIMSVTNLITYSARVYARMATSSELLHHAVVSMEFITAHINEANSVEVITTADNTLVTINMRRTGTDHIRIINFGATATPTNRLMFGGQEYAGAGWGHQEVARYINDIQFVLNESGSIAHVTIVTEDSIGSTSVQVEPIVVSASIELPVLWSN